VSNPKARIIDLSYSGVKSGISGCLFFSEFAGGFVFRRRSPQSATSFVAGNVEKELYILRFT
jgi:hypothetical protein